MAAKEPQGDDANADAEGAIADGDWFAWKPMQVLVSDSRRPRFASPRRQWQGLRRLAACRSRSKAELHSGGPYTNATARITAMFDPQP